MCGRYSVTADKHTLEERFGARLVTGHYDYAPTYNAAPSQLLPIITNEERNMIILASWGFAPEWADEHWTLPPLNNARIEGIDGKHTFHDAYKKRHCLVLADGFFEWKEVGKQKLPYHFTEPHRELFAMAGIWDHSPADGGLPSYAILTTAATGVVSPVHHRMPIILPRESEQSWLLPSSNAIEISSPETAEHLLAYEVTSKVTKASFNNPEAIKPLEAVVN